MSRNVMAEKAKVVTGSSLDILSKLCGMREAASKNLSTITDDPNLVMRCEAILAAFDDLHGEISKQCPRIEQMKGVAKGLQLSVPVVAQHGEILKGKYTSGTDPDKERLKHGLEIVLACKQSLDGAITQQREELVRVMGAFDGAVTSALSLLKRVEVYVENAKHTRETEASLRDDPFAASSAPVIGEAKLLQAPLVAQSNGKGLGARREAAARKRKKVIHDSHN